MSSLSDSLSESWIYRGSTAELMEFRFKNVDDSFFVYDNVKKPNPNEGRIVRSLEAAQLLKKEVSGETNSAITTPVGQNTNCEDKNLRTHEKSPDNQPNSLSGRMEDSWIYRGSTAELMDFRFKNVDDSFFVYDKAKKPNPNEGRIVRSLEATQMLKDKVSSEAKTTNSTSIEQRAGGEGSFEQDVHEKPSLSQIEERKDEKENPNTNEESVGTDTKLQFLKNNQQDSLPTRLEDSWIYRGSTAELMDFRFKNVDDSFFVYDNVKKSNSNEGRIVRSLEAAQLLRSNCLVKTNTTNYVSVGNEEQNGECTESLRNTAPSELTTSTDDNGNTMEKKQFLIAKENKPNRNADPNDFKISEMWKQEEKQIKPITGRMSESKNETVEENEEEQFDWDSPRGSSPWHFDHPDNIGEENRIENIILSDNSDSDLTVSDFTTDDEESGVLLETDKENETCGSHTQAVEERQEAAKTVNHPTVSQPVAKTVDDERSPAINKNDESVESRRMEPVPQQPSGRKLFIGFSELTAAQKARQEEKQIWGRTKSGRTFLLSESQKAERSASVSAAENDGSVALQQMEKNLTKKEVSRDQSALSYGSSENKKKTVEDSPIHVDTSLCTSTTDNT